MSVTYDILDKEGKVLYCRKNQACFSEFPYARINDVEFTNIGAILYKVKVKYTTQEDAELYLAHLKTIGFPLTQTPKQILKSGFLLDLNNCQFAGAIRAPAVGAALTAVRYIEEFSRIIGTFLNILDIDPTLDLWLAFRLAHVFNVVGVRTYHDYFGLGHCLFTSPYNGGHPTKTWPQVVESLGKSTKWKPGFFSWHINITYGNCEKVWDHLNLPTIIDLPTLKDAIAWLN